MNMKAGARTDRAVPVSEMILIAALLILLLTGCGTNRIELEKIEKGGERPDTSDETALVRDDSDTAVSDRALQKDCQGRWILDRNIIRDVVYSRVLQNRMMSDKNLEPDKCLLDVLCDLDALVRGLGGGAVLSSDAIRFFVTDVKGAEFVPWHYAREYRILPTDYGVDVHLLFDEDRIRKDGISIENGRFRHVTTLREKDGSMKNKTFWISMHVTFSVAQKIRIFPPNSKKAIEGFGIALNGVAIQVIAKIPLQSLVMVCSTDSETGTSVRRVVAALEGFTIDKEPRTLHASSESLFESWLVNKKHGVEKRSTAIAAGDRVLSDEEILGSVRADTRRILDISGAKPDSLKSRVLEVKQAVTPVSLSIDYWYVTAILLCSLLYSFYRILRPVVRDASKLAGFVLVGCVSLLSCGLLHIYSSVHKLIPLFSILHLHGRK